ncbi:MAG: LacI family DNA-binding transcriptional regulator [Bacteroidales bacterium]|nr:LacI family DNA-binding transcriptional regulator [Bacteroidales bacterium]
MVTITDIAEALGITPSTVSRALAGNPRVREETRQAVLEAAERMGYERNVLASNLRRGKSDIVGIVVPRINREFFSNLISGAESILGQAGYRAIICQTHEELDTEIKALHTLRLHRVAGVFFSHCIEATDSSHVLPALGRIPLVQFDRVFRDLPGAKIVGANFEGAYEATTHLILSGYKRIGTLAGYLHTEVYSDRLRGYRKALEDNGIPYDQSLVFPDSIFRETGYASCHMAIDAGCDALYCAGDYAALGSLDALREHRISVPDDFGLVGTANEFFTELTNPSISSVGQRPYDMGREAAIAFLESREGVTVIPMELHIRQSSNRNNIWLK